MEAIREYIKVVDHKINFTKQVPFDTEEVEVIILPCTEKRAPLKGSFVDFIRNSPLADEKIILERNKDHSRDIIL